jgi:hypothetical protein
MTDIAVTALLDIASLGRIRALENYQATLEPEFESAMLHSVQALEHYAYGFMWATFQDPSGQVEDSLGYGVDSPYQGWMGTDSPYGRRLEYGFSGMTDALGRYFAAWPIAEPAGYQWAQRTLQDQIGEVNRYFRLALVRTANSIAAAGGTP